MSASSTLAQTAGALLLVLGVIFALAWLLRRMQGLRGGASQGALQVRAGINVGARERVLWVQAGDKHLLLGVAPGRVQTLHVFDEPPLEETAASPARLPSFAEALAANLRGMREGER